MTSWSCKKAAEIIKQTQKNDNDIIIVISGARGLGKSTLMSQISKELNNEYKFEDYIYNKGEFIKALSEGKPEDTIHVDEAISTLFKREFQHKNQNAIVKLLNMHRDKRYVIFLLLPHFWDLDSAVRNTLIVKWWIHVYKRGDALIFTHDDNPGTWDPWNRKGIYEAWSHGKPYVVPNYVANIRWSNLKPEIMNSYKEVKTEKRKKYADDSSRGRELTKKEVVLAIRNWNPNVIQEALARVIGSHRTYVTEIFNEASRNSAYVQEQ